MAAGAAAHGVTAAAASVDGGGWWGTRAWRQVAVASEFRIWTHCWQQEDKIDCNAHHCILCCLTPCLLCHLHQGQQLHQMTMQWWARWPMAGDFNIYDRGEGEGGIQPVTTETNIFPPPTAPPSTISISFSLGLSTVDVAIAVAIVGDCRQRTTGLRQWAAWWEVRWEVWWEVQWEVQWENQWDVWWEVWCLVVFNKSFWHLLAFLTPAQGTSYIRACNENIGDACPLIPKKKCIIRNKGTTVLFYVQQKVVYGTKCPLSL